MSVKLLPALVLSVLLGLVLGCIPVLNQHLQWYIAFVPISGLIYGLLVGAISFGICYKLNTKVGGWEVVLLVFAAMVGYAAIDYGAYQTMVIRVEGVEEIPDGDYRAKDLMSFAQFMDWRLSGLSISGDYGSDATEFGGTGAKISYAADLGGALLASLGVLVGLIKSYPFCEMCGKFKRRQQQFISEFKDVENKGRMLAEELKGIVGKCGYSQIVAHCRSLCAQPPEKRANFRIKVDQRYCPDCYAASLVGTVERRTGRNWYKEKKFCFVFHSKPGEHAALLVGPEGLAEEATGADTVEPS